MTVAEARFRHPQPAAEVNMQEKISPDARTAHPAGAAKHGPRQQIQRVLLFVLYFSSALIMIFVTQVLGAPIYFWRKDIYYAWMSVTKKQFALVLMTVNQWWSPTRIRVTGDASVKGELHKTEDGRLETRFPERMVLIANHQIYTDWVYLWWTAYTSRMHGHIFIILKESLKWIPILGWGMQFFGFIFMSRKWASDQSRLKHRLSQLSAKYAGPLSGGKKSVDPMWLLIFPEGTNMSVNARASSIKWSEKSGIPDMRHVLLPRHTGLLFCLRELRETVDWVYDCTLSYEGIPRGQYGQDIFGLWSTYFEGRPPKSVHLHWRKFAVADMPLDSDEKFQDWLHQRWLEKDELLEYFMENGEFPADGGVSKAANVEKDAATIIDSEVRLESSLELVQIPLPAMAVVMVLNVIRKMLNLIKVTAGLA